MTVILFSFFFSIKANRQTVKRNVLNTCARNTASEKPPTIASSVKRTYVSDVWKTNTKPTTSYPSMTCTSRSNMS